MMNPPIEQQLLEGIEQRNDVICRQAKRIEALEAAAKLASWKMHIEYRRVQPDAAEGECWSEVEQLDDLLEEP